MAEDSINAMRGYKAATNNPNISKQAKKHAESMLQDEVGGDEAQEEMYGARGDYDKSPNRVAGGLKAAMHNPGITESGKKKAKEQLGRDAPAE
ncbi:Conidiation protein 6-domain-containing protein [Aspergillus pseudoustus]|uniref:Conidiation protein 6-domain-containing protein n=1 Tax=Aspergillus pseudoustus TaxID=1810923 RepID=A0ABR4J922_9EURO